jgi:hypothetical protein
MPRTIEQGLTPANLNASIDEVIAVWTEDEWKAFINRYVDLQFNMAGVHPRASIPAQADDDDLIFTRVVHYARIGIVFSGLAHHLAHKAGRK